MKYILSICLICYVTMAQCQDFYDMNTIQTIEITFAQSNWDQLLDAEKNSTENYILAESVTINGTLLDSVGVKYKGNSTYSANQTKNPFHIELDTYKDHDYEGYKDIKLSNVAKDPSFLREVLSYAVIRNYMDAPLSNYANVYVNGNLIGLYSNSEAVSKRFVNDRFYSKDNAFVKCNPPAGAGPGSNDYPNLVYMGADSSSYYDAYELKSDSGWSELIDLCDTLANHTDQIEEILDIDRAIWMLALNNVLVNLDSYIGGFTQNYYLYRDDNGRFAPVIWDLNESFARFTMTGSGSLNSNTAKQQMSPFLHSTDASFPLVQKILNNATYKRMYIAHYKTILLENFDNNAYFDLGLELQTVIDAAVQADNNKFFTYANFTSNLTSDISGSGGGPGGNSATIGITNLMDARSAYVLGLADFTATQPQISDINLSSPTPIIGEAITITAAISDANNAILGYRDDIKGAFTKVSMFDDGAHNDGAAGDGIYGAEIAVTGAYIQYYVYGENNDIGMFSPQRAEHEYHTFTATTTNNTAGDLVINEFMASNDITQADQDDEYDDWVELYNNTSSAIDLTGYFLSDDPEELTKWAFPEATTIDGNGYLIIWADNDDEQEGLHATFKLSASAESVILVDPDGNVVDEISYIDQVTDVAFGRFPNGTGEFQELPATFNAENKLTTSTADIVNDTFVINMFPNPASHSFRISLNDNTLGNQALSIYDIQGKVIHNEVINASTIINCNDWQNGLYLIKIADVVSKVIIE